MASLAVPHGSSASTAPQGTRDSCMETLMQDRPDVISDVLGFCPREAFLFLAGVSKSWKNAWLAAGYSKGTGVRQAAATQARTEWVLDEPMFNCACQAAVGIFGDWLGVLSLTAAAGNLGGLKAAASARGSGWASKASGKKVMRAAADGGHLEVLKWARAQGCPFGFDTSCAAARGGHLEVLKWLVQQGCPCDEYMCSAAAEGGHLEVLEWALDIGCELDEGTCNAAAEFGHVEVLRWARVRGCSWNEDTCTSAARGGHGDVLLWALSEGCPCNEEACGAAASAGHFELLKLLRALGCPWDKYTCGKAAEAGHLEILKWLTAQGCPWSRPFCILMAQGNGRNHVVEWIVTQD
ncbi:unnamed protein product [Ascophyllum nodosum]